MTTWEPSDSDVRWLAGIIELLKDGGVWGTSSGIFRIKKTNKIAQLVMGDFDDEQTQRTVKVLVKMGYVVENKAEKP